MTRAKTCQMHDLIEKISEVDQMIKLHEDNPSKFMLEQYEAKKEKLLGYLIDRLVDASFRSPYSFRLIILALKKFYPDMGKRSYKWTMNHRHYHELKSLEAALV